MKTFHQTEWFILFLCLVSSACALTYEILWTKMLTLVLGSTSFSINIVVGSFMGGLAAGSWAVSRLEIRIGRPLRFYGVMELLLGGYALTLPHLLDFSNRAVLHFSRGGSLPFNLTAAQAAMCFLLLLFPTALMGASFPLLVRFLTSPSVALGKAVGALNLVNTLGGAIGCFAAGFYLIGNLGVNETIRLAAGLNFIVGAGVLFLSRQREDPSPKPLSAKAAAEPVPISSASQPTNLLRWMLVLTFATGFISLAYELIWTRLLTTVLMGSSIYAFTVVLTTYLLGLAIGSLIFSKKWATTRREADLLAVVQMFLGLASILSVLLILWMREGFLLWGVIRPFDLLSFSLLGRLFVMPLVILIVPAILMGISFPLMARIFGSQPQRTGRSMGIFYAANTLGSIAGSLIMGFLFFQWLGTGLSVLLLSSISILIGFVILVIQRHTKVHCLGALALLAVLWIALPPDFIQREIRTNSYGDSIERWIEGPSAFVWGSDSTRRQACFSRQLDINDQSISAAGTGAERYMKFMSHAPILLHPAPKDVLVICFGTGITAGAATIHPRLNRVDCVDLCREVVALGDYFEKWNHRILKKARSSGKPQVNVMIEDGRSYLLKTARKYDVITMEPPPPNDAGVVNLYTREFYRLCASSLNDGGMVVQWIPLHCQEMFFCWSEIRTFLEVFPNSTLWLPAPNNFILIGKKGEAPLDFQNLKLPKAPPGLRDDLHAMGVDNPEDFLMTYFMGPRELARYVEGAPVITDDQPLIEYFMQKRLPMEKSIHREKALLEKLFQKRETLGSFPRTVFQSVAEADRFLAFHSKRGTGALWKTAALYLDAFHEKPQNLWFQKMMGLSDDDIQYWESLLKREDHPQRKPCLAAVVSAQKQMRQRNYAGAHRWIQKAIELSPQNPHLREFDELALKASEKFRLNSEPQAPNFKGKDAK